MFAGRTSSLSNVYAPNYTDNSSGQSAELVSAQSSSPDETSALNTTANRFGNQKMPPEMWRLASEYLSIKDNVKITRVCKPIRQCATEFLLGKYLKPEAPNSFLELTEFLKRATKGSKYSWLSAFYQSVLAEKISNKFDIFELEKLFDWRHFWRLADKEAGQQRLATAKKAGLLQNVNEQKLKGPSSEHITYLTSEQALWSLVDLHLQNLNFDLSVFLQIKSSSLKVGMTDAILRLSDNDVADQNIREKICQFLSSLRPNAKENGYSNVETLDERLEALNSILQEQSREAIKELALMTQCGIFANRINAIEGTRGGETPLYHRLAAAPSFHQFTAARLNFDVAILLAAGTNPSQQNLDGNTSLHYVSQFSQSQGDIFDTVLGYTKDVNARNTGGQTALHFAAKAGKSLQVMHALIHAGANIKKKDNKGKTALHHAVEWNNGEFAEALIEAGANTNEKNNDGETAESHVIKFGSGWMLHFLLRAVTPSTQEITLD